MILVKPHSLLAQAFGRPRSLKHNPQIIPANKESSLFDNVIKEFVDLFIWVYKIAFIAVLKIKKEVLNERSSNWNIKR